MPLGPEQNLSGARLDGSAGHVQGCPPHGVGHLVEGESHTPEGSLGDFNGDLVRAHVGQFHVRDALDRSDFLAHLKAQFLQRAFVRVAADDDFKPVVDHRQQRHDRALGLYGKRGDGIDPALDLVGGLDAVGIGFQFQQHAAVTLTGGRCHPVDALDALHGLFDTQDDTVLDFFRRSAQVGNRNTDRVQFDTRKFFLPDLKDGNQPADDENHHQQVRGDGVADKPANNALHDPAAPGVGIDSSATTSTRMPSITACSTDRHTRSPFSRPPSM